MRSPVNLEPWDDFNRDLAGLVRPPDWRNPRPADRYNLVVIGAGTAGLVCAAGAAALGARVALVERHLLGGDCLNAGCVPSKALLSAARVAAAVRDAHPFGVRVDGSVRVDFAAVMERMRRLRASIAPHDSARRFQEMGVHVFFGTARFVDRHTVAVGEERLRFSKAVIASGSRPAVPAISGLATLDFLTNETLFSLTELPRRLAIIGAGPIGCEMAQAFARFGADVLLVENRHGLLPREEREAARIIQAALERDGVRLMCCGKDLKLSREAAGIRLQVASHDHPYDESADCLLVAAGRRPNLEGLDLDRADIAYSDQGVGVNDFLQTSNPRVYAAGDVCSSYQFTHAADFMARIVLRNALFAGRARVGALTIPWCTYTDPEIARVGLSPQEAAERGVAIDTFTRPLSEVDRAVLEARSEGLVRIHVRQGSDRMVGATVVAANAGDLIAQLSQAMTHGLRLRHLAATIHPYPTQAEAIRQAADLYNRSRLTPMVRFLLSRWLAWRR